MTEDIELKRNPYGVAAYSNLRTENYAYIDKTQFIETLEKADTKTPFLVRPRRFGKTLFTRMLQAYYDKAVADEFDQNFAGTYIASHKTPLANSYYVLRLDCSGINASNFSKGLADKIRLAIGNFSTRYRFAAGADIANASNQDSTGLLTQFIIAFERSFTGKIYLIIDEYDHFANEILATDVDAFRDLTSDGGELKTLYSFLKDCCSGDSIDRVFITGVTSISLDSMTSGFNIADNLTSDPAFATFAGFTEAELRQLIPQILDPARFNLTADDFVHRMKDWYNGYRFSAYSDETVFNASMCLYYLGHWKRYRCEPENHLDPAVASDLSKINRILQLGNASDTADIVQEAISRKPIDFVASPDVLNLQNNNRLNRQNLLTALVYFGYLTYAPGSLRQLVIPNRAIAQQFFDVYFHRLHGTANWNCAQRESFAPAIDALSDGNPQPLAEAVSQWLIAAYGAQKDLNLHESDFQTAMLMAANFATDYDCLGEPEAVGVENHRYPDILLTSRRGGPSYLFELKHVSKTQAKERPDAAAAAMEKACEQLAVYRQASNLRSIPNLQAVAVVYVGRRLEALKVLPV